MSVPKHGQVALSGSAQALSATPVTCAGFTIKAPISNKVAAYVGSSTVTTSTGFQLDPGDELTYERLIQNGQPTYQLKPSDFYAVGTSGDVVTWLASP